MHPTAASFLIVMAWSLNSTQLQLCTGARAATAADAAQQQLSWLSLDDSADQAGPSRSVPLTSTPASKLSAHQVCTPLHTRWTLSAAVRITSNIHQILCSAEPT